MIYNVLWTGGWDSTYRVLNLVLDQGATIQPYYVNDPVRPSTEMEKKTIEKIKRLVVELDPSKEGHIKETIEIRKEDIPQNEEITALYHKLANSKWRLGDQYDWLPRYVHSSGIEKLELSIHNGDKAREIIIQDVVKVEDGNDSYYVLKEAVSMQEFKIFKDFRFPLLDITKLQMEENAKQRGYAHIMEETWFCHTPRKDGKSCGLCNPCKYAMEEGLGRRVTTPSTIDKLQYKAFKVRRKLKKIFN
ncbi:hypothetical protein N781_01595 [Pontibacillus halophilus JSM 076056 = DSM 19796]|uniref:7-cyano-7-deazaguanine synthase n=1 Tax=Pontibacillus halophilus JSM 076056 = DSM 19796 TaxID=1385510 RepID=A0A0A5IE28_9BACI|nr:7-cyano-7-deazaguanine synthase [Pontibacillus halophilus]KGX94082.1 hypothetical protein N781_01595 [Pontibacillus halophilus JSM 076056 = DSM 19796]